MTTPDWFHELEDHLYSPGDVLRAVVREDRAHAAWTAELGAAGASPAEHARRVTWRESERVLSLQRLMGG